MRRVAFALALLGAVALTACGGGEDPPPEPTEPPAQLLGEALATPVGSGEAQIDTELALEGDSLLAGPVSATLDGPFEAAPDGGFPSFDLGLDASVAGFGIDGEVVSTGDDAFVVFFGENYRVGEASFGALEQRLGSARNAEAAAGSAPFGLRIGDWFLDPRYEGAEEVGGTQTERISADLDSIAASRDLAALVRAAGAPPLVSALADGAGQGTIDAWVAFDDQTIRRINVQFPFTVPPALLAQASGITGGTASLRVELSGVGVDVEIEQPAGGGFQPIEDLIGRLQSLAQLGL